MAVVLTCCLFLFGADARSDPTGESDGNAWQKFVAVGKLAKGRVLACFIWKGMKPETVTRILGHAEGLSGGIGGTSAYYNSYGITVHFSANVVTDGKYDPRVVEVVYRVPWW